MRRNDDLQQQRATVRVEQGDFMALSAVDKRYKQILKDKSVALTKTDKDVISSGQTYATYFAGCSMLCSGMVGHGVHYLFTKRIPQIRSARPLIMGVSAAIGWYQGHNFASKNTLFRILFLDTDLGEECRKTFKSIRPRSDLIRHIEETRNVNQSKTNKGALYENNPNRTRESIGITNKSKGKSETGNMLKDHLKRYRRNKDDGQSPETEAQSSPRNSYTQNYRKGRKSSEGEGTVDTGNNDFDAQEYFYGTAGNVNDDDDGIIFVDNTDVYEEDEACENTDEPFVTASREYDYRDQKGYGREENMNGESAYKEHGENNERSQRKSTASISRDAYRNKYGFNDDEYDRDIPYQNESKERKKPKYKSWADIRREKSS